MSNTAPMGMNLGEARRRQEAAKRRGERFKVDEDVRTARLAVLEAREAKANEAAAQAKAKQEAAPTALQAVLGRATVAELSEISRMISRLDGRRLQALVDEEFRAKSRTAYIAPVAVITDEAKPEVKAPGTAQKAPPAPKASSGRPRR